MMEDKTTGELQKTIEEKMNIAKWQAFTSGKIEGALDVLFLQELDKDRRVELLARAVGLSHATANDFIEQREIEEE